MNFYTRDDMSILELRGGDDVWSDVPGDAGAVDETCELERCRSPFWFMMEGMPAFAADGGDIICEGRILCMAGMLR
jgi:hypothetical protein